jgi:uroporphyrinogen decarboxylase
MRQAGRWDPEFNRLRASLSFYEFSQDIDLAAQASLLPRRFGVDGIILFYDITTLAVAMGLPFTLRPGQGPVPDQPIRSRQDVNRLEGRPDCSRLQNTVEVLRRVKAELRGTLPVIVFAGAPFTLATYCIGTGKDLAATRRFVAEQPATWEALLEILTEATIFFLEILIREGADLLQLFDSWAGMLDRPEYVRWAQARHRDVFRAVPQVPRILFVKEGPYLDLMVDSTADVISLGRRHDLAAARRDFPHLVFQGNVDSDLLRSGSCEQVAEATKQCLSQGAGQRHIVNLNHGVAPTTPPANFQAFVQTVVGCDIATANATTQPG